ncbi:MAG: hypothetical protein WCI72_05100 [archaeon]
MTEEQSQPRTKEANLFYNPVLKMVGRSAQDFAGKTEEKYSELRQKLGLDSVWCPSHVREMMISYYFKMTSATQTCTPLQAHLLEFNGYRRVEEKK